MFIISPFFLDQPESGPLTGISLGGWSFCIFAICWSVSAASLNELWARQTNGPVAWKERWNRRHGKSIQSISKISFNCSSTAINRPIQPVRLLHSCLLQSAGFCHPYEPKIFALVTDGQDLPLAVWIFGRNTFSNGSGEAEYGGGRDCF